MFITVASLVVAGIVFALLIALLWRQPAATGASRRAEAPPDAEARPRPNVPAARARHDRWGPN